MSGTTTGVDIQLGSGEWITLPNRRCYALSCEKMITGISANERIIPCQGGCGVVTFCSLECQLTHREEMGHKIACPHIKASRNNSPTTVNTETPAQAAQAQANIETNLSFPAVVIAGVPDLRRFRVGQRVMFAEGGRVHPGTIVTLYYCPNYPEPPCLPYEIESDQGTYCSAPIDCDFAIRRMIGAPVLCGDVVSDDLLQSQFGSSSTWLQDAKNEILSGLPLCTAVRTAAFDNKISPKLDKFRCSKCGQKHKVKLSVCSNCKTAAYCNRQCQTAHFKEHKQACKKVKAAREQFDKAHPNVAQTPHGRQFVKANQLMTNRFKMIETFLMDKTGLVHGGAHFMICILVRAFRAVKLLPEQQVDRLMLSEQGGRGRGNPDAALRDFAVELEEEATGIDGIVSSMSLTTENLVRLVWGVLYFWQTDPDVAAWCAVGVDLIYQTSHLRAVSPRPTRAEIE